MTMLLSLKITASYCTFHLNGCDHLTNIVKANKGFID